MKLVFFFFIFWHFIKENFWLTLYTILATILLSMLLWWSFIFYFIFLTFSQISYILIFINYLRGCSSCSLWTINSSLTFFVKICCTRKLCSAPVVFKDEDTQSFAAVALNSCYIFNGLAFKLRCALLCAVAGNSCQNVPRDLCRTTEYIPVSRLNFNNFPKNADLSGRCTIFRKKCNSL